MAARLRRGRSTCRFGAGLLAIDLVALFQLDQRRLEQRRVGLERFEAELELGVGIVLDEPDGLEQREAPDERGDLGLEGFALGVDGEELWIFAAFLSVAQQRPQRLQRRAAVAPSLVARQRDDGLVHLLRRRDVGRLCRVFGHHLPLCEHGHVDARNRLGRDLPVAPVLVLVDGGCVALDAELADELAAARAALRLVFGDFGAEPLALAQRRVLLAFGAIGLAHARRLFKRLARLRRLRAGLAPLLLGLDVAHFLHLLALEAARRGEGF
mmetsp:Transcript_23295/g.78689  ORF Transcript_23295/g.78689 Transcript_23295/m.78689 type:complete len:269 (-) Transcript_23295:545-1351(-)